MWQADENLKAGDNKKYPWLLKRSFFIYLAIVLIIGSFGMGLFIGKNLGRVRITPGASTEYGQVTGKEQAIPDFLGKNVDFKLFWEVWNVIQDNYIDRPVGESKLFYGALEGMVVGLGDPFSSFMEPKNASEFTEELSGKFEGAGMEIGIRNDVLTVISPLPESPAEKAGVRAADVIISIDDFDTKGIDINDAVKRIRGEKGSTVKLKVYRAKTNEIKEISVMREVIKIVSVKRQTLTSEEFASLGDKKIEMITVTNFNSDTAERFARAVQEVVIKNPDGLILDLRGNPGGYLDSAIQMASYWLPMGEVVVSEQFAGGEIKAHMSANGAELGQFKTAVLINGGSASGSEIVAGALQDHGVATVIGEKSFGKGSVQELQELSDGSAVKITIARWLTPKGRTIDKEGIKPDILIERTEDDYNMGKDPQMERAVEFLIKGK